MPRERETRRRESFFRRESRDVSKQERVVTLYETERIEKVAMLRMALDDAGIPHTTANEVVSTVLPTDGMVAIRFQVLEGDLERAQAVLRELGFM